MPAQRTLRRPALGGRLPPVPAARGSWGRVAAIATAALLGSRLRKAQDADVRPKLPGSSRASNRPRSHSWVSVLREVRVELGRERVVLVAAGVTFYTILAVFPAVAALVALYGLFADPVTISQHLAALGNLLPGGAIDVIRDEITRIAAQGHRTLGVTFIIGLLASLWSANGGVKALLEALNLVYGTTEKRGFVRLNAISLGMVVGGIIFLLFAMAAMIAFPALSRYLHVAERIRQAVMVLQWPLLIVVVAVLLGLIYRYGPSRPPPKWEWVTWGSAFAAIGWALASALFSWYAAHFGTFNKTYGSLGAVIGFMTWIWISAIVILVGAEINNAVERLQRPERSGDREIVYDGSRRWQPG